MSLPWPVALNPRQLHAVKAPGPPRYIIWFDGGDAEAHFTKRFAVSAIEDSRHSPNPWLAVHDIDHE